MKLTELHIKNFGSLKERRIVLNEGINLIYGPNESGKTTLHTFIRGMFYGIARKRGRASRNDLYSRCEPWDNSTAYAGMLRFESGGKIFRLSRSFAKANQSAELICESDGEKLSLEQGDLKVLMGNVSENVFENTVFIGQMKSRTDTALYEELRNYIVNYEGTGDGDLDIGKAQERLKAQQKELAGRQKLEQLQQDASRKEQNSKIAYLQEEVMTLQSRLEQTTKALHQNRRPEQTPPRRLPGWSYGAVIAAVVLLVGMIQSNPWFRLGSMIMALLCLGGGFLLQHQRRQTVKSRADSDADKRHLLWKQEQLQEQCEEKRTTLLNLQDNYREFCEAISENNIWEEEIQGIMLAMTTIAELSSGKQSRVEKEVRREMAAIIKALTRNRYTAIDIDADQNLALHTSERYIPLERTSRGTIEQVYFALRMAVSKILCSQELLPIFLDDVFAMYDETRLQAALEWLAENKQQTLIFTCHKREAEILQAAGLPYHKIEL